MSRLFIPESFEECLSYEEQVTWLYNKLLEIEQFDPIQDIEELKRQVTDIYSRLEAVEADDEEIRNSLLTIAEKLRDLTDNKQDKLTPGDNIEIIDNVISAKFESGKIWYPYVDENGNISWTKSTTEVAPEERNIKGPKGDKGFSPVVTVTEVEGGNQVSITDEDDTQTFTVLNGKAGENGTDGISPEVKIFDITGGTRVTIDDVIGEHSFDVMNGKNGTDGTDGVGVQNIYYTTAEDGTTLDIVLTNGVHQYAFVERGLQGEKGADSTVPGPKGTDGVSPTATVTQTSTGATISITDKSGTTTANISNGEKGDKGDGGADGVGIQNIYYTTAEDGTTLDIVLTNGVHQYAFVERGIQGEKGADSTVPGPKGTDGVSPTVTVTQTATGATISITDKSGTTTANISNGEKGGKGDDGVSPTATVTQTATGATISITDKSGTTTANISNGAQGEPGPSNVTPVLTEGTKIATINGQDIYAPAGGGSVKSGTLTSSSRSQITSGVYSVTFPASGDILNAFANGIVFINGITFKEGWLSSNAYGLLQVISVGSSSIECVYYSAEGSWSSSKNMVIAFNYM